MIGALRGTLAVLALVLLGALSTARAETPDEALDALLAKVRSEMPEACDKEDADTLVRILCTGTMRVGVRWNYPMFSTLVGDTNERIGYDTAVAGAIAARLGVKTEWVHVRAATRISTLAEGGADVVIATMGHTKQRDGQTRYIRPHYYSSETIVVGPRELDVSDWDDIKGWRVCSTIGNHANSYLVTQDVRLMLFESAVRLPEALEDGTCRLASQDDSFFASFIAVPEFGARFERKFGFHAVPWGMAVAQTGSDEFATALELISAIMHRDGEFLELGVENSVFTGFLEEQHDKWRTPTCADASAIADADCVLPALDNTPLPTRFADEVDATVEWMTTNLGFAPQLPMLTSVPAFELFTAGIVNSLILVLGALGATLGFSLVFGFFSIIPLRVSRFVTWGIVTTIQSSPVILTLVVAGTVATTIFT